jgi:1-hydroxycarotenoid 3,4-desaturase
LRTDRVVIVGAGIGGLAAAVDLAVQGIEVVVFETAAGPGGKMRAIQVDGVSLDAGPTVFTMREVFEELFASAGVSLNDHVSLKPLDVLARHAWSDNHRLDLFADIQRSADAIGNFAGAAEADGFLRFTRRSREIFETLDHTFMRAQRPSPVGLVTSAGMRGLGPLSRISPFATMWTALGGFFRDSRLRQLFARYATYCGSSPFDAPGTLMLVAHAEQKGVWIVEGGMHQLAAALVRLAELRGAVIRYGCSVAEILTAQGRASGLRLSTGETVRADAVVSNADTAALASGLFGRAVQAAVPKTPPTVRSLSAVTWLVHGRTGGFPLSRHSVFFSNDYPAEFNDIFSQKRLPSDPTVYVCAQDRNDTDQAPSGRERLLCLVNAPPTGDRHSYSISEVEQCRDRSFRRLERCGLRIDPSASSILTVTPTDFDRLYPGTGGALYGRASHGWMASFQRPGSRSRIPGLYLAGGSTHPGPGVPMAAISGRLAAEAVIADLASTRRSRPTAIPGGMSMRSATMANMG